MAAPPSVLVLATREGRTEAFEVLWRLVCGALFQLVFELKDVAHMLLRCAAACHDPSLFQCLEGSYLGWCEEVPQSETHALRLEAVEQLNSTGSSPDMVALNSDFLWTWNSDSTTVIETYLIETYSQWESYTVYSSIGDPLHLETVDASWNSDQRPTMITSSLEEELGQTPNSLKFGLVVCWMVLLLLYCALKHLPPTLPPHHQLQLLAPSRVVGVETKTTHLGSYGATVNTPTLLNPGQIKEDTACSLQFTQQTNFSKIIPEFALLLNTVEGLVTIPQKMFLALCYQIFSVAYNRGVHSLPARAQRQARFRRAAVSVQVPLYGCPNEGYCAMIAIGLDHVQEASVSYSYETSASEQVCIPSEI